MLHIIHNKLYEVKVFNSAFNKAISYKLLINVNLICVYFFFKQYCVQFNIIKKKNSVF